jgi:malonyl CoA-acyl carrier protein transacylase
MSFRYQASSVSGFATAANSSKAFRPSRWAISPNVAFWIPPWLYISNVTGRGLRSAEAISEDFVSNIGHGVRWYDATTVLGELGFRLFLEMPPQATFSLTSRGKLSQT